MSKKDIHKAIKGKKIVIAPSNKITEDAYQLVRILFHIEGALITNESILEDFMDFDNSRTPQAEREMLVERIAEEFGVVVPEVLFGETRIWRVVEFIYEKQRESLLTSFKRKKERMVS